MIIVDCEQGTEQWEQLKIGVLSSSKFDKIITPTGKKSTQAKDLMNTLLAEWVICKKTKTKQTKEMTRGIELESEARELYEFIKDIKTKQVGFCFKDERRLVGCSPDCLFNRTGLEIKSPNPGTHVGYLLGGGLPLKYIPQVQGSMYVTGYSSWQFMSYSPGIEPFIIKVERDNEYIKIMDEMITAFIDKMCAKRKILKP